MQPSLFQSSSSSPLSEGIADTPMADRPANWVVDVVVDAEKAGFTPYTYALPSGLSPEDVPAGSVVTIAFGHQQAVQGYVLATRPKADTDPTRLKSIDADAIESGFFSPTYWHILKELSRYTVTPLARVIQAALPPNIIGKASVVWQATTQGKQAGVASVMPQAQPLLAALLAHANTTPSNSGLTLAGLLRKTRINKTDGLKLIRQLQQAGLVTKQLRWADAQTGTQVLAYTLTPKPEPPKTAKQQTALASLTQWHQRTQRPIAKTLAQQLPDVSDSLLAALVQQGHLAKAYYPNWQVSQSLSDTAPQPLPTLSEAQQHIVETIQQTSHSEQPWLVYGVTGSGKTAVYMHLINSALQTGKQALMLVPEITLTGQLAKRLKAVFPNAVIWHSNIAQGERLAQWYRIQSGEPLLIIGARSAALLPLDHVSVMILDEAHDASFKQESPEPRYHAQTVCQQWVNQTGATLVLGSATPDIGDRYTAERHNRLLTLPERYGNTTLASVEAIDLRQPTAMLPVPKPTEASNEEKVTTAIQQKAETPDHRKPSPIAPTAIEALRDTIDAGQQAMVLINRRGYHTLIQCQHCGQMHQCPHCDVSLTVHQPVRTSSTSLSSKTEGHVLCHHCGYRDHIPDYCPQCASRQLRTMGTGSQRVVEALDAALPNARIVRLDRDSQQRRHEPDGILTAFANHQADILVGTQMIAKGLDIPNVTLVVVLQADQGLLLPDYRASERTFQLLTQVAGRSGRGQLPGKVLVQTWQPDHPVLTMAMAQNYDHFYAHECEIRQKHHFPPFSQLFRFVVRSQDEALTQATATALAAHARQTFIGFPDWPVEILGPAPCVLSRIQGWFRWHVLVKVNTDNADIRYQSHGLLSALYQQLHAKSGVHVLLDVDTLSLL